MFEQARISEFSELLAFVATLKHTQINITNEKNATFKCEVCQHAFDQRSSEGLKVIHHHPHACRLGKGEEPFAQLVGKEIGAIY